MPTYEYICENGHTFERFQKMSARPVQRCPTCGGHVERKVSGGQGLIFKGHGFYITDYGKDGKGPRSDKSSSDSTSEQSGSAESGSSDSAPKPAAKPAADAAPAKSRDSE